MANETYSFEIAAEVTKARKAVDAFSATTQKQLNSISFASSVTAIKAGFDLLSGAARSVFGEIKGIADEAISGALESEKAQIELANALRLTGDAAKGAQADMESFASEIQKTTTFTDEQALSALALAKQYNLTNIEAKKAVKVAADLAAVTGTDLSTATQKVSQTFTGFVDRSLGKTIPALKNLTAEALLSGQGLDLIAAKVKGSAEIFGNTFGGSVAQAKNSIGEFTESIGKLVTENPAIIAGIKAVKKVFEEFSVGISKNNTALKSIVTDGFLFLIDTIPFVIKSISVVDLVISSVIDSFKAAGIYIAAFASAFVSLSTGSFKQAIETIKEGSVDIQKVFLETAQRRSNTYDPLIEGAEKLSKSVRDATKSVKDLNKEVSKTPSTTGFEARKKDLFDADALKKQIADISKEPIKFTIEALIKAQEITTKQGIAIGAGLVANITKGAAGAKNLLTEAFGTVADNLLHGIGGPVKEIIGVLAEGPEKTKQMVQEFARAIPTLIQNLAESLPVLIETLVREGPPALAKAMPQVALSFSTALISNIPKIVAGFIEGLKEVPKAIVEGIKKSLGGITSGISSISGGGKKGPISGLGIPIVSGIAGLVGLANGGRVPNITKFEGDKFPARLNANEQVLSSDLSNKLESFLNNGGQSQQLVVNLQIGQSQLARAILDLNRNGFRTA